MPAPDWENLDQFLALDDFATRAIFKRDGVELIEVFGIFDDPYYSPEIGEYTFENRNPRLTVKERDVVAINHGDTAEIDGITYDVIGPPESDGTGMSVVNLATQPEQYNATP